MPMVTKIKTPRPSIPAPRASRGATTAPARRRPAAGRAAPTASCVSELEIESIQIVRLRRSSLPAASARNPGAAPVVTTTSGRSRAMMRSTCQITRAKASRLRRVTLPDRIVAAVEIVVGRLVGADIDHLELRKGRPDAPHLHPVPAAGRNGENLPAPNLVTHHAAIPENHRKTRRPQTSGRSGPRQGAGLTTAPRGAR